MTQNDFDAIKESQYYAILDEHRDDASFEIRWILLKDGGLILGEYGLPASEKDLDKQHNEFTLWKYGDWTPHTVMRIFDHNLPYAERSERQKWEIDHFIRCVLALDLNLTIREGQPRRG